MEKTMDKFNIGAKGKVVLVLGEGKIRRRLFDMGITPGASFYIRKKAPLGDPIEINIRDYELTLRKSEAQYVICEMEER